MNLIERDISILFGMIYEKFMGKVQSEWVVFSSEYLAMPFAIQELPNQVKYDRKKFLFDGFDIKILVIYRSSLTLLEAYMEGILDWVLK